VEALAESVAVGPCAVEYDPGRVFRVRKSRWRGAVAGVRHPVGS
jgi:hypothetical protein